MTPREVRRVLEGMWMAYQREGLFNREQDEHPSLFAVDARNQLLGFLAPDDTFDSSTGAINMTDDGVRVAVHRANLGSLRVIGDGHNHPPDAVVIGEGPKKVSPPMPSDDDIDDATWPGFLYGVFSFFEIWIMLRRSPTDLRYYRLAIRNVTKSGRFAQFSYRYVAEYAVATTRRAPKRPDRYMPPLPSTGHIRHRATGTARLHNHYHLDFTFENDASDVATRGRHTRMVWKQIVRTGGTVRDAQGLADNPLTANALFGLLATEIRRLVRVRGASTLIAAPAQRRAAISPNDAVRLAGAADAGSETPEVLRQDALSRPAAAVERVAAAALADPRTRTRQRLDADDDLEFA